MAQSQDGTIIVAADHASTLWRSTNSGSTWSAVGAAKPWNGLAVSSDGSVIAASFDGDGSTPGSAGLSVSSDVGTSWSTPSLPSFDAGAGLLNGGSVAVSGDGTFVAYADAGFPEVWTSDNTGVSFTKVDAPNSGTGIVQKLAASRDGTTLIASWTTGIAVEFLDGAS